MTTTARAAFPYAISFIALAESAVLVQVGDQSAIDQPVVDAVIELTRALDASPIGGVTNIIPAYSTILIEFDPIETDCDRIEAFLTNLLGRGIDIRASNSRIVIIPVVYGDSFGPDLIEMAAEIGLTPESVVQRHSETEYGVACMGFSPGWAYLLGLPVGLSVPRLRNPRTRVPAGSVAVGGAQTGVYPSETPGGWRLIGRTPLKMFDPQRDEPFLLRPGDRVRFVPIDIERFETIERQEETGLG